MAGKLNLLTDAECKNATSGERSIRKLHGGGPYLWVVCAGIELQIAMFASPY